jgi:hypothetical protein
MNIQIELGFDLRDFEEISGNFLSENVQGIEKKVVRKKESLSDSEAVSLNFPATGMPTQAPSIRHRTKLEIQTQRTFVDDFSSRFIEIVSSHEKLQNFRSKLN